MPISIALYVLAAFLTIVIVVRLVRHKVKPDLGDLLTALGIAISIIFALNPPQSLQARDESKWIIRKDYTKDGIIFEESPGEGWTLNPLDRNVIIRGPFRLYIQFQEAKGVNSFFLYGREPQGISWWQGIMRFEIGLDENGTRVFYNVRDGTSETDAIVAGDFSKPKDGILQVEFDSQGKRLSILDSDGYVLRTADVSQFNTTANGIFPEDIKLVELGSGPHSEVKILRLLILEPAK